MSRLRVIARMHAYTSVVDPWPWLYERVVLRRHRIERVLKRSASRSEARLEAKRVSKRSESRSEASLEAKRVLRRSAFFFCASVLEARQSGTMGSATYFFFSGDPDFNSFSAAVPFGGQIPQISCNFVTKTEVQSKKGRGTS